MKTILKRMFFWYINTQAKHYEKMFKGNYNIPWIM